MGVYIARPMAGDLKSSSYTFIVSAYLLFVLKWFDHVLLLFPTHLYSPLQVFVALVQIIISCQHIYFWSS